MLIIHTVHFHWCTIGVVSFDIKTQADGATDVEWYKNTYYGVSYAVNDNLSVSYQKTITLTW